MQLYPKYGNLHVFSLLFDNMYFLQPQRDELQRQVRKDINVIVKKLDLQYYVCHILFKNITNADDDFHDLWKKVKKLAPKQSLWNTLVPTHWIEMERRLQLLKFEGNPVINYKDLLQMAPPEFPSPTLFMKFMQTSGFLLTLDVDNLKPDDEVVIDLQWLIDAFRQVIDFENCSDSPYGHIREIANGKLTLDTANEIWKANIFSSKISLLLKFMQNLGLITKPHGAEFYSIPSLFEPMPDKEVSNASVKSWLEKGNNSKTLVLDFRTENKQVPFPHFDKIMTKIISQQHNDSIQEFKRNFCICMNDRYKLGFVVYQTCSVMKVTMFTKDKSTEVYDMLRKAETGKNIVPDIVSISKDISSRYKQHEEADPMLGLSCNPYQPDITYAEWDKIWKEREVRCCKSPHCKMVEEKDLAVWHGKSF